MADEVIRSEVRCVAENVKAASVVLGQTDIRVRNGVLAAMAQALRVHMSSILAANVCDMDAARTAGIKESLLDRLMLNEARVEEMALSLEKLINLPDPLGQIQERRTLYNGIDLVRVRVPLGVVAVVYEARPNVCVDAAGICLKSGNACILRGGSQAAKSNAALAKVLQNACTDAGLPVGCIGLISSADRVAVDELMQLHGIVDVLIPRGGASLIRHCVEHAKVPVIETGTGNCHVYIHESADEDMAHSIVMNAKCRRFGVCNAVETLLVDRACAETFLPKLFCDLARAGVLLHCDDEALRWAEVAASTDKNKTSGYRLKAEKATEYDWETEYLAPELAVKCVDGVDDAIEHINRYGTKHSEAIVANSTNPAGERAIEAFLARVDAAAVYANASTAFTDGGQFGLGAEIGISTQKLHARGPFALEALTSYKYVLRGAGQVRA